MPLWEVSLTSTNLTILDSANCSPAPYCNHQAKNKPELKWSTCRGAMLCRILIFTEYIWLTERQRHNTHLRFWVEIDQGLSKTLEGQSRPGSLPGPLLIWICVWQQGTYNVQISDQLNAFEQRKSVWPIHFFPLGMHPTMPVWNTEQGGTVTINYQSPEENALSPMGPLLGENCQQTSQSSVYPY